MPTRILNNCILLPIEAESQDTALRIFSTLNDRGKPLSDPRNLESLGNKALLEKRINIGAADYRFEDKKKYYIGFMKHCLKKGGTKVRELIELANALHDFTEADILERSKRIMNAFVAFLQENDLTA